MVLKKKEKGERATTKGSQKTPAPGQGLNKGTPEKIQYRPIPEAWRGLDKGTIERLCIMTVDGGLTDQEAERRFKGGRGVCIIGANWSVTEGSASQINFRFGEIGKWRIQKGGGNYGKYNL